MYHNPPPAPLFIPQLLNANKFFGFHLSAGRQAGRHKASTNEARTRIDTNIVIKLRNLKFWTTTAITSNNNNKTNEKQQQQNRCHYLTFNTLLFYFFFLLLWSVNTSQYMTTHKHTYMHACRLKNVHVHVVLQICQPNVRIHVFIRKLVLNMSASVSAYAAICLKVWQTTTTDCMHACSVCFFLCLYVCLLSFMKCVCVLC